MNGRLLGPKWCESGSTERGALQLCSSEARYTHTAWASQLRSVYAEMRDRQRKAITKEAKMRGDSFFSEVDVVDERRCLAISALLTDSDSDSDRDSDTNKCCWNENFSTLMKRLKDEFGHDCMVYSPCPKKGEGQLHWTLLQLVSFNDYEEEMNGENSRDIYKSENYLTAIQDSLNVGGLDSEMEIDYVGIVVVSTGILMVGYPSKAINNSRDELRRRMKRDNLPIKEPFVNDIVHR